MPHHSIRGLITRGTGHPPAVSGFKTKIAATAQLGLLPNRTYSLHEHLLVGAFYFFVRDLRALKSDLVELEMR